MKILIAHNRYQQAGGEDVVYEQEGSMLASSGFEVRRFTVSNDHIQGAAAKLAAARSIIANGASVDAFKSELSSFVPDVVHVHNFFPTLSPAAIELALSCGYPVVLTLHNYRLICAGALLLRDGMPCESCVGHSKWPGIQHGCYRGSHLGSAAVGRLGPYVKKLLRKYAAGLTLIALTEFAKERFIADGFPEANIIVRGNSIADPGPGLTERERRIVFVGRLSVEKNAELVVNAARGFSGVVEIIGDGPERSRLERLAPANVLFSGHLSSREVLQRIKAATALAVPSRWYEGFPMVVLEALATGTPILASRIGALPEIVEDGKTGQLLLPGDTDAWTVAMEALLAQPSFASGLGVAGRQAFLAHHSVEQGIVSLSAIYRRSCSRFAA